MEGREQVRGCQNCVSGHLGCRRCAKGQLDPISTRAAPLIESRYHCGLDESMPVWGWTKTPSTLLLFLLWHITGAQ
jgi:hypothetical protein